MCPVLFSLKVDHQTHVSTCERDGITSYRGRACFIQPDMQLCRNTYSQHSLVFVKKIQTSVNVINIFMCSLQKLM